MAARKRDVKLFTSSVELDEPSHHLFSSRTLQPSKLSVTTVTTPRIYQHKISP